MGEESATIYRGDFFSIGRELEDFIQNIVIMTGPVIMLWSLESQRDEIKNQLSNEEHLIP